MARTQHPHEHDDPQRELPSEPPPVPRETPPEPPPERPPETPEPPQARVARSLPGGVISLRNGVPPG